MRLAMRAGTALTAALLLAGTPTGAAAHEPEEPPAPSLTRAPSPPSSPTRAPSSPSSPSQTPSPAQASSPAHTPSPAQASSPAQTPSSPGGASGDDGTATPSGTPSTTPTTAATPTPTAPAPTESVTPTTSATPTKPASPSPSELHVVLTIADPTVHPGDKVNATARVYTTGATAKAGRLKVTASRGAAVSPSCTLTAGSCDLGDVTSEGDLVPLELSVPARTAPGPLRITTAVSSRTAPAKTVVHFLTVAPKATTSPSVPAPASPQSSTPPVAAPTPQSVLPSAELPQDPASTAQPSADAQLPPIIADTSPTPRPLALPQNVAALHPAPSDDTDVLIRLQTVWLGILLAFSTALSLRLRHSAAPGAHRRTSRGRFTR